MFDNQHFGYDQQGKHMSVPNMHDQPRKCYHE